ncbi:Na(+)/H(+) antiporter subunit E [alpha proteobacterium Q-1]|nr:Na(+)/H(+) antiporter subunit E [alpha proteobacterium Q-1]
MIRSLVLFLALCGTWLLWSGIYEPLLLSLGLGSCLFVIWLSRHLGIITKDTVPVQLGLSILGYWMWLLKEIAQSNFAVIRAILSPKLDISPGFLKFEAENPHDLGQVILGNSITLTPGTVTCDMLQGVLLVHSLDDRDALSGIAAMSRRTLNFSGEN